MESTCFKIIKHEEEGFLEVYQAYLGVPLGLKDSTEDIIWASMKKGILY